MKNKIKHIYDKLAIFLAGVIVFVTIGIPIFRLVISLFSISTYGSIPSNYNFLTIISSVCMFIGGIKLNEIYAKHKE